MLADLERWAGSLSDDELRAAVLKLAGMGPFTATNVLQLLGRFNHVPCDSETKRHLLVRPCATQPAACMCLAVLLCLAAHAVSATVWLEACANCTALKHTLPCRLCGACPARQLPCSRWPPKPTLATLPTSSSPIGEGCCSCWLLLARHGGSASSACAGLSCASTTSRSTAPFMRCTRRTTTSSRLPSCVLAASASSSSSSSSSSRLTRAERGLPVHLQLPILP